MQPIRRTDQVSKGMYEVIQKSIVQHRELTNQIKQANEGITGVDVPVENTTPAEATSIPMGEAMASGRFTYKQFGLYKEADTDSEIGRIWVKKSITNPKTGNQEEWLVAYTSDEEELIRQVANAKLKEILAATPNPKDIPIAQGIKSKNITIDESGASGTAKVTVEFTDVDQGLKFYQEDVAGGNKAEVPAEDENPPAVEEEEASADKPPAATPAPKGQAPQVQPGPMPQMGQASLKSDGIKKQAADEGGYKYTDPKNNYRPLHEEGDYNYPKSKHVNIGGNEGDRFTGDTGENKGTLNGDGVEFNDMQAQDAFGQMLTSGDRVKDETGRKGIIDSIVDQDNARVTWDSSDLAEEGLDGSFSVGDASIPEDFTPGLSAEVVPTMSLTKWAATTLRKMTKGGSQVMDIIKNIYPSGVKYSFINEGGHEVALSITSDLRTGAQIQRPDTKQIARVGNFIVQRFADKQVIADEILADMDLEIPGTLEDASVVAKKKWSPPWLDKDKDNPDKGDDRDDEDDDDDDTTASLINGLVKEALDVSDQVAPMSWKSDGGDNAPSGAGPSLPPKQDLQPGQNGNPQDPNNPAGAQPVYDSAKGQAPSFQTTVNPDDRSVTVKFVDSPQQQKLDQTVQNTGQPDPMAPTPTPPPAGPPAGVGQGQAPAFDDLNSPNQF